MTQAQGGQRHCGPRDGTGRQRHGLGNDMGCTSSWARGGQQCCRLRNDIVGLGTAPAWSIASSARVRQDGGA
jgi:hypothetical protein